MSKSEGGAAFPSQPVSSEGLPHSPEMGMTLPDETLKALIAASEAATNDSPLPWAAETQSLYDANNLKLAAYVDPPEAHFITLACNNAAAMAREVLALREAQKYLRPEVQAFARMMEDALRRKDGERGGNSWQRQTQPEEILPHLQERSDRIEHYLKQAYKYRQRADEMMEQMETENAGLEAVHAANFAMMIADICSPLAPRAQLKGNPDE